MSGTRFNGARFGRARSGRAVPGGRCAGSRGSRGGRHVEKINPLLGSAGIASVPIAARVTATVALQGGPENFLIYQAMGPNLAGVFGTALSGGIMLALLK